jgi:pyruvate,orthophosphate dikinase
MLNLLGGKGANLCQMTKLGLPVPQGFIVSTDACNEYQKDGEISSQIKSQIEKGLKNVEKRTKKKLGSVKNPLILSVRSGARVSMPGMMDSILNLGLNDEIVKEYAVQTQNPKFAYDCYRRFIQMYSNVVYKVDSSLFETAIDELKKELKIQKDQEFTVKNLQTLIKTFKKIFKTETGKTFPQDVFEMLLDCVEGVFKSWNNDRAIIYREMNNIPDNWGTAVNVQEMVFGNMNNRSGTGVCFSRNPTNGENKFYGEFLLNAQGEDIVAGVRTPSPIEDLKLFDQKIYDELYGYAKNLEKDYHDMQDMEFTIENGKLFVLQTRNAKRTTLASIVVATDLVA